MDRFEEYKLLYQRTEKLSERRQATSQIYLTINTAIFGAIAFLVRDSGLAGRSLIQAIGPLFIVGTLICIIWLNIILNLERVLNWQYGQLRAMEAKMRGGVGLFTRENNELFESRKGRKRLSFTMLEAWLPRILGALYLGYFIAMALAAWQGTL